MITALGTSGSASSLLGRLQSVELGHADVHQHDVGLAAAHDIERRAAVAGLADHRDVGLGLEDHLESGAQQPLVVGDDRGDRRCGRLVVVRRQLVLAPQHARRRHAFVESAQLQRADGLQLRVHARPGDPRHDLRRENLALRRRRCKGGWRR